MNQPPALPRRVAWFAPWTWRRRVWIVSIPLLTVAYALSFGPVFWLSKRNMLPQPVGRALDYFYLPLFLLACISEWGSDLLDWYLSFFVVESAD